MSEVRNVKCQGQSEVIGAVVEAVVPHSALNVPHLKAVLFDAVGTLIYADPPVFEAYAAAGRKFGIDLPPAELRRRTSLAMRKAAHGDGLSSPERERARWQRVVQEVFCELPTAGGALFEELWQHFAEPTAWRVDASAGEVLAELVTRGFIVGIASNFDQRLASVCAGLPSLAGVPLHWSSEVGYSKPDVRFFRTVETRLALRSEEILLVGDDPIADFQGARAAGWHAVHLSLAGDSTVQPRIQALAELPALLANS